MNWDAECEMARDVREHKELYEAAVASPDDEGDQQDEL